MALVHLEGVHVDFPIYGAQRSLRRAILQRATGGIIERRGKHQERVVICALNGVSMRLEDGDRLGLIGHNGSGKSTLLKVIAGIYQPITGRITIQGRITPLLDMMPGLDPEDTGYENIVTAGLLLGMTREELDNKISEIEEFSELGEYLALPVRTYSAGMILRLGFSLVTALEPGILLMDEGFSTGDTRFTERAVDRMNDFIGRSRIIVLASHSHDLIQSMCNKAALMQEGTIVAFGSVDHVLEHYQRIAHGASTLGESQSTGAKTVSSAAAMPQHPSPGQLYSESSIRDVGLADRLARTSGAVRFRTAIARDERGQVRWVYRSGETVTLCFEYEVLKPIPSLALYFGLYRNSDNSIGQEIVSDAFEVLSTERVMAGQIGTVDITVAKIKLMPGSFYLYVCLGEMDGKKFYDVVDANVGLPAITIESQQTAGNLRGCVRLDYEIRATDLKALRKELAQEFTFEREAQGGSSA
jgi:ABC-type polysaccharide/polyol phosphate transport system ATPase subunit